MRSAPSEEIERLLTFEVASAVYALPIAEVHEVVEVKRICCVPTLGRTRVGVMNWHGDALPVVSSRLLFDLAADADADAETQGEGEQRESSEAPDEPSRRTIALDGDLQAQGQLLVVSGRDDEPAMLGLPIDRVIGLVDGPKLGRGGPQLIVERRPEAGRVLNVVDPRQLVARAIGVIGQQQQT